MRYILFSVLLALSVPVNAKTCPRIISQSPYITKSLQWLGLEQCIVGVSRYDSLDLPRTGGILDPDNEAIDSLMADIIFTTNWITEQDMQKATPEGVKFYRLKGFDSLNEISDNLQLIVRVTGQQGMEQKIERFRSQLDAAIHHIKANHASALLLSSCSGTPYSFGKQTWLYELFQKMGFRMVETHHKIRHIRSGNEIAELSTLLETLQPDILFIFERKLNTRCNLILPKTPVKIIALDGEKFLHPAPVLLQGLQELHARQSAWN